MFKGFDFIKNSFTASVSGSPSFLFPFIRNTSLRAAARIPVVGGRSALNILSTAVKQARGWGLHEKDTFRRGNYGGKLYFFRSVGEQPDKFRLFLYGGNLYFSVGSLILWIASGLSRTAASCACSGNRLFSFGMVVSFYVIFRIQ